MVDIFLPTLHTFAMNNIFTGSKGLFRFRAEPKVVMANPKEVDFAQSAIHVEYWHGLYCYEKSTMEGECTFPMSEEGREEMRRWLEEFTLEGFPTNAELSYQILYHPEFILGECTTAFLDEHLSELLEFSRKLSESGVDA